MSDGFIYTWQAFDEDGNLVWEQEGTESSVALPEEIEPGHTIRVTTRLQADTDPSA